MRRCSRATTSEVRSHLCECTRARARTNRFDQMTRAESLLSDQMPFLDSLDQVRLHQMMST